MENASKALLIVGGVLIVILIIAISLFIYNKAEGNVKSSAEAMTTREIEAFNDEWLVYEGKLKGHTVKTLLLKLVNNANMFLQNVAKVPGIQWTGFYAPFAEQGGTSKKEATFELTTETDLEKYVKNIAGLKSAIEDKHKYNIEFTYDKTGYIDKIIIEY